MAKKEQTKESSLKTLLQALNTAWSLGFMIVTPVIVLSFLGLFLDKKMGTTPFLTIGGLFLGTIAGIIIAIKEVKKILK